MIINAATVLLTLAAIGAATYVGLKLIRAFALQIAKENHDAVLAMDRQEETMRLKQRQRNADAAAESAFAKVKPIVTTTIATATTTNSAATARASSTTTTPPPPPGSSPSSGNHQPPPRPSTSATLPPGVVASASV
jgi:hypothetical protein